MESLFSRLHRMFVKRGNKDRLVWMGSRNGAFSVKSLYSTLKLGVQCFFLKVLFGIHGSQLK